MVNTNNLALRPNCLLTRYPIVFINPPRSLFWHEKLGGWYQDLLTEHGYQVYCPPMAFRDRNLRFKSLENWLKQQKGSRFHFVLTRTSLEEFKAIFDKLSESTFTFSDDFNPTPSTRISNSFQYLLHRWFCSLDSVKIPDYSAVFPVKTRTEFDRLLDRCIELAENDHI